MGIQPRVVKQVVVAITATAFFVAVILIYWQSRHNQSHSTASKTVVQPLSGMDPNSGMPPHTKQTATSAPSPTRARHSDGKPASEILSAPPLQGVPNPSARDDEAEHKKRVADAFEKMLHDDGKHVFQAPGVSAQAMFEKEAVDASWAPLATQEIQNYLTDSLGDRYDVSMVDCRSDICEIRATGQPNGNALTDTSNFQDLWTSEESQNWFSQQGFDDHITTVSNVDGIPMFVVFLSRH